MKYCKVCKIAGKPGEDHCPKCKAPLSSFGGVSPETSKRVTATVPGAAARPVPAATSAPATFQLQGEVRKLEETKKSNLRRGRTLGLLCLVAAVAIVAILYGIYDRMVLSYAVLEDIQIRQDPNFDLMIYVSYRVTTPGRVSFDRRSGERRTEKLDNVTTTGEKGFRWAWPSDAKAGIDFRVVYREGWFLASEQKHFDVSNRMIDQD
jgi:hypothetical protein